MSQDVWGKTFEEFMALHPRHVLTTAVENGTLAPNRARLMYESGQRNSRPLWDYGLIIPTVTRPDCRYCRTAHQRGHSNCPTCGAPYPA